MKIAFIVSEFPALSETFILNQITGLLDSKHDVEIFARKNPHEEKTHSDVEKYRLMERVHYFNIPENRIIGILKAIYLIILNFHKCPMKMSICINIFRYRQLKLLYALMLFLDKKFDIIHCHFGNNGILGTYLKEIGIQGKYITSFHGYDMSAFIHMGRNNIYKNLFLRCDLCMPVSNYWKKKLVELGCKEDKIMVHRMGINLEKFKFFEKRIQPDETMKIVTIGRLVEKKGYEYTIKAIAEVAKKHKNIEYLIVGDGPLRNELEFLVSGLEIKNYVKFLGEVDQDEVLKVCKGSHIFVLPSVTARDGEQEGIPVVLMEAQAVGLPVISTYHSGIPEVVVDGKSGFLVREKDVDALAERIEYLIEHPEIWLQMGEAGRKLVEEKYDIRKLNQKLIGVYQSLLQSRGD